MAAVLVWIAGGAAGQPGPVETPIVYQGQLSDGGQAASGEYEMYFVAYNQAAGGDLVSQAGSADAPLGVDIEGGLFSVELDLHAGQTYNGTERWLEVHVRRAGQQEYTALAPRQRLAPAPFANFSLRTRGVSVSDDGNVGIGTSSPLAPLHVVGSDNDGTNAAFSVQSGGQILLVDGNEIDSNSGNGLYLNHNSTNPVVLASGGGFVGVGTANPAYPLDVEGDVRISGDLVFADGRAPRIAAERTATVNFGPIGGGGGAGLTGSLSGAMPGDTVIVTVEGDTPRPFIVYSAHVPAPDTFRFLVHNLSGSTQDAPPFNFTVVAIRR
jgi:hypothetical protein